jgi:hypothetical protein
MSGPDYWRMVITSYTNKDGKRTFFPNPDPNVAVDPWPLRPWPARTTKGGKDADIKLKNCERAAVRQKDLELSDMMGVTPKRTRSQAQVMGYASATEVFQIQAREDVDTKVMGRLPRLCGPRFLSPRNKFD